MKLFSISKDGGPKSNVWALWLAEIKPHEASWHPVVTAKSTFHRVAADGVTWVFTLRGPWAKTWQEYNAPNKLLTTLTHGKKLGNNARAYLGR